MEDAAQREARPSPDALLETARRAEAGRLKLFLGAAPGVGKTYEMLTAAHARRREGVDVAVGVVETHGRAETEALLAGLEVIPRRVAEYKGHRLAEMDLDAILARRPALVLVDELAHSNAPGSRHAKRYLDVEELLAAGIDVYTTLNIQHLESLSDVVARITRIRVRETVPDSIVDRADEVEVIDLTPEDLIQRLKEGKVYVPRQAERAIRHYFSPGNLTALRELALRRTAQRVDAQMLSYMQSHAIRGPWPAGERVLACIDDGPGAAALVRHARRLADQLRAPWAAVHVETARTSRRDDAAQDRVAEALRLAERLGGSAVTIPGQDVVDAVLDYAREHNYVHVIISRARRAGWRFWLRGAVERRLIRRGGDLTIHLLPAPAETPSTPAPAAAAGGIDVAQYAGSAAMVLGGLIVAQAMRQVLANSDVALVFLTAVLTSAITYGLWPSLFACLLSALAYNFFFLPPLYTFTIADPENVVALFFFAVVALLASNLAARVRAQAIAARERARTTEDLYQFSRKLGLAVEMDDLLWATAHQIALMLRARVVLLLPDGGRLAVRAGYPPEDVLAEADLAAATWCWQHTRPAGRGAETLPGAKWLFLPMRTGRGTVGVVGIDRDAPAGPLAPEQHRLLNALADQAALAIERVRLVEDLDRARLAAEADRLRAALLTSISHDLRTPLASILGSASSLAAHDAALDAPARAALARTIQEEAERLNRFIGNLLDMTRLEAGRITPDRGLADLSDAVGAALRRAEAILAGHRVRLDLPADLPMLAIDMVLFEQVLFNLLDNAVKYAPPGTEITLRARRRDGRVQVEVLDEGPGIPAEDLGRIFDKFYRARATDRRPAGTGLGLAICRGFIEAMGGRITAANRMDRSGAVFTLDLPEPTTETA
jgi:two-component system, OmpR family, sensor histidine kinase KdpD